MSELLSTVMLSSPATDPKTPTVVELRTATLNDPLLATDPDTVTNLELKMLAVVTPASPEAKTPMSLELSILTNTVSVGLARCRNLIL